MNNLKEYLDYLKYDKDLSKNTIYTREKCLHMLFKKQKDKPLTFENLRETIRQFKQDDYSLHYIHTIITAINSYLLFLIQKQVIKEDFTHELNKLRPKKIVVMKDTLSLAEIESIIHPPPRKYKKPNSAGMQPNYIKVDEMWDLFFEFAAKTGCRVGEITGLKIGDINWADETFLIRETKTGEQRIVPLPPDMIGRLKEWLDRRGDPPSYPFFKSMHFARTKPDKPVGESMANKMLKDRAKRAGLRIDKRFHIHSFRHSFITALLREDVGISKVQRIVGHKKLDTTMLYTHMVVEDLKLAMMRHPLIRKSQNPRDIINRIKEEVKSFKLEEDERLDFELTESTNGIHFSVVVKPADNSNNSPLDS